MIYGEFWNEKENGKTKRIFIDWQNDFSVRFSMFRKYLFREKCFKSYTEVLYQWLGIVYLHTYIKAKLKE